MSLDIRNLTSAFIAAPSNNRKVWTRQVRSLLLWTFFPVTLRCGCRHHLTKSRRFWVYCFIAPKWARNPRNACGRIGVSQILFVITGRMLQFTTNDICCVIVRLHSSIRSGNTQMLNNIQCTVRSAFTALQSGHLLWRLMNVVVLTHYMR